MWNEDEKGDMINTDELLQSEEKFRYIAEFSPLPLAIVDEKGNYEYLNPQFREVFGYTLEDIPTGKAWFRLAYPDPAYRRKVIGAWLEDLQTLGSNVIMPRVFKVTCKDGSEKDIKFRSVLMDNGKQLVMGEDVTERKRAEEAVKDRNLELTTLYNLSTHMRAAKSSTELLPIVLEETCRLLHAHDGMVVLYDSRQKCFTINVGVGRWAEKGGKKLLLEKESCLNSVLNGEAFISPDCSTMEVSFINDDGPQIGPAVFVPIQSQEEVMGILVLARHHGSDPFSPSEGNLLNAVGEMAGNALQRQQLHEKAQERMEQLEALRKIDTAITANTDLYTTLKITLAQITEMLQVDGAAILRLNPDKTMQYLAWRGFFNINPGQLQLHQAGAKAGRGTQSPIWQHAVSERHSVFIPDLLQDGRGGNALTEVEGFVAYGAVPLVARDEIHGVLEVFHRKPLYPGDDWLKFMETLAGQTAIAIDNDHLLTNMERANVELTLAYDATIEGWAYALDLRDEETEGHSQRVTEMTVMLALAMDFPVDQLLHIRRGALLHDIGKMGIPDAILHKPGKLTEKEWEIMRLHPHYAREMLYLIEYLRPALHIPYSHHEKWDGSGYPQGLKGKDIPLEARIFAVVDVYDALTSDRPYRPAWTRERALELIRQEQGKHFDPRVAELFLKTEF